ncbi:MAG TPA: hypothetical protein VHI93_00010 [Candidatus Thermoplasmatota archaeon]|nr:hypothetical protein [Candidatus Thermoplasmatota archaeon]
MWEHVRLRAEVERIGDAHVLHAWVDNGCAQPITLLGAWTPDEKVRDRILDPAGQPVPRLLVGAGDPKLYVVAPSTTLEDRRRWDGRVSAGNGRSEPAAPGTYTWQVEALVHLGARTFGDAGWDADRHTLRAEVRFSV